MFGPGDHVMWQSEVGVIGPVKILARHGNVSYKLGLPPWDLKKAKGLQSTVPIWKVRACTKEETKTLSMRLEALHIEDAQEFGLLDGEEHDQETEDVDMEDLLDDMVLNTTAYEDQERGDDSDDGATNTPMDDEARMDDGRSRRLEFRNRSLSSEEANMRRNNTRSRSRSRADGRRPEILHKGQSSDPASSDTPGRRREQVPKSLLELFNDEWPPNDLTSSSDLVQNSPTHRSMTNVRKGQVERREMPTKETTPRSRKEMPSPTEETEEWTILGSKFYSASSVPFSKEKGVVIYRVKTSSGATYSTRHTELPANRIQDFQEWHVNHPKNRAPKAWEADIKQLRRDRGSDQDYMGEDYEEDVEEGNREDEN
ncbi:hypothetical protein BKA63DRAFT_587589 [Paraphoma chrysanthemicola]|nr:hypothetical protein BKA63DRAFT_587589 [Paraphoma chrysanthemicola]